MLGMWQLASGFGPSSPNSAANSTCPRRSSRAGIIVTSETNGARVYGVDEKGQINPQPQAANDDLLPDCQSPVLVGNRLYGVANGLFCLDASRQLAEVWHSDDPAFSQYASLIGSSNRLLITTLKGKLLLINLDGDRFDKVAELDLFDDEQGLYSHPAIVGQRLYVRGSKALVRLIWMRRSIHMPDLHISRHRVWHYPNSSITGFPVVMGREIPLLFCGSFSGISSAW